MKKIPLELSSDLRQTLKTEAKKQGSRPRVFANEILIMALEKPDAYISRLEKNWDGDKGPELVVEIAESEKRALKKLAKKKDISLKQLCLHILMRYFEINE